MIPLPTHQNRVGKMIKTENAELEKTWSHRLAPLALVGVYVGTGVKSPAVSTKVEHAYTMTSNSTSRYDPGEMYTCVRVCAPGELPQNVPCSPTSDSKNQEVTKMPTTK